MAEGGGFDTVAHSNLLAQQRAGASSDGKGNVGFIKDTQGLTDRGGLMAQQILPGPRGVSGLFANLLSGIAPHVTRDSSAHANENAPAVTAASGGEAATSGASFSDIAGIAGGMQNYMGSHVPDSHVGTFSPDMTPGQAQSSTLHHG